MSRPTILVLIVEGTYVEIFSSHWTDYEANRMADSLNAIMPLTRRARVIEAPELEGLAFPSAAKAQSQSEEERSDDTVGSSSRGTPDTNPTDKILRETERTA